MGFKRWARLEEVLSDDLNAYLATQVVCRFANAAQRGAELPAPEPGQVSLLLDTGRTDVYLNGAWCPLPGTRLQRVELTAGPVVSAASGTLADFGSVPMLAGVRYELAAEIEVEAANTDGWNHALRVAGATVGGTRRTIYQAQTFLRLSADYVPDTSGTFPVTVFSSRIVGASPANLLAGMTHAFTATAVGFGTAAGPARDEGAGTLPAPDEAPEPRTRRRKGASS